MGELPEGVADVIEGAVVRVYVARIGSDWHHATMLGGDAIKAVKPQAWMISALLTAKESIEATLGRVQASVISEAVKQSELKLDEMDKVREKLAKAEAEAKESEGES